MKKKILALCLVVVLAITAVTGATLAYFTDTDKATNTMTLGNVKIVQNEKDKDNEDFEQNQDLFPAVYPEGLTPENIKVDGWFNEGIQNVIDKVITVTNEGTEEAYVRTIIAFETKRSYKENSTTEFTDLHDHFFLVNTNGVTYTNEYITIDGTEYVLAYKVYAEPLAAGATSEPSLKQFAITPEAGNEIYDFFGADAKYNILAVSQAVQTEGFGEDAAVAALNEAFGEITAANAAEWFN